LRDLFAIGRGGIGACGFLFAAALARGYLAVASKFLVPTTQTGHGGCQLGWAILRPVERGGDGVDGVVVHFFCDMNSSDAADKAFGVVGITERTGWSVQSVGT
jgi:hypothetical protein